MSIKNNVFLECIDLREKNSIFFGDYLMLLFSFKNNLTICSIVSLFLPYRPPVVGEASLKPQDLRPEVMPDTWFAYEPYSCLFIIEPGRTLLYLFILCR